MVKPQGGKKLRGMVWNELLEELKPNGLLGLRSHNQWVGSASRTLGSTLGPVFLITFIVTWTMTQDVPAAEFQTVSNFKRVVLKPNNGASVEDFEKLIN